MPPFVKRVVIAFTLINLTAISGCNPANTDEQATEVALVSQPIYSFNGAQQQKIELPMKLANYIVEFQILSSSDQNSFTQANPPMPLTSRAISLYLRKDHANYNVVLRGPNWDLETVSVGSVSKLTSLRLVNSNAGGQLFVNGKKVWSGRKLHSIDTFLLGRGFEEQRFWKGSYYKFRTCSFSNNKAANSSDDTQYEKCG
jgi:hypothetical protein